MTESRVEVVIVGAGLAGLACARALLEAGVPFLLLERDEAPGGRIRTDRVDGFLLDRGFQVLLTAYPAARDAFDYPSLRLDRFDPGALVYRPGRMRRVADPWRQPAALLPTLTSGVGSFLDKLKVSRFRSRVLAGDLEGLYRNPARSIEGQLTADGFSRAMIESFFRPFFGGITLDPKLTTSSRMSDFVFRMFSLDEATLPEEGMEALPRQMVETLPSGSVRFGVEVEAVEPGRVHLSGGDSIACGAAVVATDAAAAGRLVPEFEAPATRDTVTLYFDAPEDPVGEPILVLDGEGRGPVNHLAVVSTVQPSYAPEGRHLVAASVIGGAAARPSEEIEHDARDQLTTWFGAAVERWKLVRAVRVPEALPVLGPEEMDPVHRTGEVSNSVVLAGDHRETPSIQGALESGSKAAEVAREILARETQDPRI